MPVHIFLLLADADAESHVDSRKLSSTFRSFLTKVSTSLYKRDSPPRDWTVSRAAFVKSSLSRNFSPQVLTAVYLRLRYGGYPCTGAVEHNSAIPGKLRIWGDHDSWY